MHGPVQAGHALHRALPCIPHRRCLRVRSVPLTVIGIALVTIGRRCRVAAALRRFRANIGHNLHCLPRSLDRIASETVYVAQHESLLTSFLKVSAASFSPSTIVRYG